MAFKVREIIWAMVIRSLSFLVRVISIDGCVLVGMGDLWV